MSLDEIITVVAGAASVLKEPLSGTANKAFIDAYEALKKKIFTKTDNSIEVKSALEGVEKKPSSSGRRLTLMEELEDHKFEVTEELLSALIELRQMVEHIAGKPPTKLSIKQSGRGNSVNIAGRDLIQTNKVTRKNIVVTDERHIDGKQALAIQKLVDKVAIRLADQEGKPNYKAVYGMLKRKMQVPSYKEILKEDYDEAVSYLRQLGAQNRSKLKKSNPREYSKSLYAAIYAKWRDLGHQKDEIFEFAQTRLELKRKIRSLKDLGSNQLKWLNEILDGETAKKRREGNCDR